LADNIFPTSDFNRVLDADLMLVVVPSVAMRSVAMRMRDAGISPETVIVSCSKGIEQESNLRMTQILREILPNNTVGALSGPNHAEDICLGLPSATLVGFDQVEYADWVQHALSTCKFRVYTSTDVPSMELGGTIKNVFAIGAGLCAGLKLGDNALAALVTRGLAEMTRLGVAYGGNRETFMGLSGMGDLVVTCYSMHSRNQRVGQSLAQGKTLKETLDSLGMVAEGVPNTLSVYQMARKAGVRTPLIDAVYSVLYEEKSPLVALNELMARDPRPEHD
jgi:glycerol-3-phosphate dehydrogenase (NAD(P)+)